MVDMLSVVARNCAAKDCLPREAWEEIARHLVLVIC